MKQMCKNCEFFVLSSSPLIGDEWGECIKPRLEIKQFNGQIQGDFTWADSRCNDFSARKNKKFGLIRK